MLVRFDREREKTYVGECGSAGTQETFNILPVRSYASLKVMLPRVNQLDRFAQSTESNLAPVFHHLGIHVVKGSEQALILPARAGTRSFFNSSFVLVAIRAATRAPPEVPVMTSGRRLASRRALMTPKW